jgi:hypothetical protein
VVDLENENQILMGREKTSGERINTETYRMDRLSVGILLTQFPVYVYFVLVVRSETKVQGEITFMQIIFKNPLFQVFLKPSPC